MGIITAPQVQASLQHSARNPKQETIVEPTLQKAKGATGNPTIRGTAQSPL
jgi:hypothetical protein